jgi:hypothetical protein
MLSFSNGSTLATGAGPLSIALGAFTSTKFQDVLVLNQYSNTLGIFQNLGNGSFHPQFTLPIGAVADIYPPFAGQPATTADLNNDGFMDIVSTGVEVLEVFVSLGETGLAFAPPLTLSTYSFPGGDFQARTVACGDVNGDGLPDLVAAAPAGYGGFVEVFLNTAVGLTVSFSKPYSFTSGYAPGDCDRCWISANNLMLSDINNDGMLNILTYGRSNNQDGSSCVALLLNEGPSLFHKIRFAGVQAIFCVSDGTDLTKADFNNDGQMDFVAASAGPPSRLFAFMSNGTGYERYTVPTTRPVSQLTTGDVNNDGKSDIIVDRGYSANAVGVFLNQFN